MGRCSTWDCKSIHLSACRCLPLRLPSTAKLSNIGSRLDFTDVLPAGYYRSTRRSFRFADKGPFWCFSPFRLATEVLEPEYKWWKRLEQLLTISRNPGIFSNIRSLRLDYERRRTERANGEIRYASQQFSSIAPLWNSCHFWQGNQQCPHQAKRFTTLIIETMWWPRQHRIQGFCFWQYICEGADPRLSPSHGDVSTQPR